jgi:glucose/arabinose dehydrogenase
VVDLLGSGTDATAIFEDLLVYQFEGTGNPVDIAEGPDGSVYLTDIFKGRIYRLRYTG